MIGSNAVAIPGNRLKCHGFDPPARREHLVLDQRLNYTAKSLPRDGSGADPLARPVQGFSAIKAANRNHNSPSKSARKPPWILT
jgi:hypothetical protein